MVLDAQICESYHHIRVDIFQEKKNEYYSFVWAIGHWAHNSKIKKIKKETTDKQICVN